MRKLSFLMLATTGALSLGPAESALAADYMPPLIIDDAPQHVPVEIGSGWYLRGDLNYNINDSVYESAPGEEYSRFTGGVGVGYHLNDLFRVDANLSYVSRDEFRYQTEQVENRVLGAMLNGYLDLGTFVGVTPYVGAGVGFLYSKNDASVGLPVPDRQYEFAYSLNAGVSYQMTDNLSLDTGYQYLSSPGTQYFDTTSGTVKDKRDYHQIKLGLRYDLW